MDIRRIITAIVCIPAAILIVHFGLIPILALLLVVAILGILEVFRILDACNYRYQKYPGLIAVVLVLAGFTLQVGSGVHLLPVIITISLMVFLSLAVLASDPANVIGSVSATLFGVLYISWLPGHLLLLRGIKPYGESLVYLLFIVTWFSDIFAYLIGTWFGRHKLAERLSPGKTWEGTIAGLVAAVVAAVLWREVSGMGLMDSWGLSLRFLKPVHCVSIGLLLGIGGQIGDLAESSLKRNAGIKDSGKILPGHGGILDRCDSLIFNIPLMYYFVKLIMN